jgi:hypothetical protein
VKSALDFSSPQLQSTPYPAEDWQENVKCATTCAISGFVSTYITFNMRFFRKASEEVHEKGTPANSTPTDTPPRGNSHTADDVVVPEGRVPIIAVILGAVASIGGFMFGYEV